jgi:hypothetical protein
MKGESSMNGLFDRTAGVLLAAAVALTAIPAFAGQPTFSTPAGTPPLPNVVYVIPYATSTVSATGAPGTETVVTIDAPAVAGIACNYQVEWVDFDGTSAGVSGPVTIPAGGTLEFVTQAAVGGSLVPFVPNVFSNLTGGFEGYANVRSDCDAKTARTGIDAEFVLLGDTWPQNYRQIEPVQPKGNGGH